LWQGANLGRLFLLCLLGLGLQDLQAQLPNRYLEEVFPTTTLTPNVVFGTNIPRVSATFFDNPLNLIAPVAPNEGNMSGTTTLRMDIYRPAGDTLTKRPVIIICFGGGFVAGSRADVDIQRYAERLARRGFVTAAIDYRLGMNIFNEDASYRGVYRGIQDGRQAVRFFRANAATYGVDPDQIYIAGHSAGGFIALHNIHLDKVGEIPAQAGFVPAGTYGNSNNWPSLGGLDGVGQNLTQSGKANMAFAWAGALGFLSYVEGANDAPACMFHSTDDGTVPYGSGVPFPDFAWVTDLPTVYGGGAIHPYAQSVGAPTTLHDTTGLGHNPHLGTMANEILVRNRMGECAYEYRLKPFEVQILGDDQVCFSSTNPALNIRTYTLSNTDNYHYEWQVVGGTFVTPPTVFSTSVQVQWNSTGTHSISVRPFQRNLARNKTLITRTVTVTAPSNPPPITCPANVSANTDAGLCSANLTLPTPIVDACAVSIVNDFNNTADASGVYPVGTTPVVWTVTDINGNLNTCTQTVTVVDAQSPNALCQNLNLNLDASGSLTVSAADFNNGSSDNCGIASILFDDTGLATKTFGCGQIGANTVIIRVTDAAGNSSTCTAALTISDNLSPVALCQNLNLTLGTNGLLTVSASDFDNGSSDNCGIASILFDDTGLATKTFSCADLGTQTVTVRFTDTNGNNSTCTANAIVSSNEFLVYSGTQFSENNSNDGSIGNALTLTLTPCREFAGANGTDLVATGAVTVLNLPTGLTAQIIKTSGNTATFSLVGNATPHTSAENVNNLTVTFLDAAFNGGNAAAISGFSRSDLQVLFLNNPIAVGGGFLPPPALTIPNSFRLVAVNTHSIALTWEVSPQAQGYRLYRYSAENGWQLIAFLDADATAYLDTNLQNDTEYRYRLEAYRGAETATANGREYTYPEMPLIEIVRPACSNNPYARLRAINRHTNPVFLWYDAPQGGNLLFRSTTTRIFEYPITSPTVFYVAAEGLRYESTERTRVEIVPQTAPIAQFLHLTLDTERQKAIYTCQNNSLLKVVPADSALAYTYTWYRYGTQVAQTQTPEYLATESGIYTVSVGKEGGCYTLSDQIAVYLNYEPEAKILASEQVFFCRQGLLSANPLPNATYRWFRNQELVGQGEVLAVSMAGDYTVEVSQYGCTRLSNPVRVALSELPENIVLTATEAQICQGSTAILQVPAFEQTLYRWYRNGIFLTTTQAPTLEVGSEGTYTAEIVSRRGGQSCSQLTTALTLDVIAVEKARLLRVGSTLKVETQGQVARVDWYFNGERRSDLGNGLEITPTQVGHYQAEVFYTSNCSSLTQRLFLTTGVTGEEQEPAENLILQVFPNPTQALFYLSGLDKLFEKDLLIEIHDAAGRVIWSQRYEKVEPQLQIQAQAWANGNYFIVLSNAQKTVVRKIIKE
jgi:acetyl esterase/lipase